ncbi:hypothetical protein [Microbispora sp. H10830]|uniref:hypothetical protein n=1 Tax=Microbispora sp. H10830 TaxID=2729109 RepID=UPI0015FF8DC6|nr:hypothetical protein [Microbispora sp. H10830]
MATAKMGMVAAPFAAPAPMSGRSTRKIPVPQSHARVVDGGGGVLPLVVRPVLTGGHVARGLALGGGDGELDGALRPVVPSRRSNVE